MNDELMKALPIIIIVVVLVVIGGVYAFFQSNKRIAQETGLLYYGSQGDYIWSAVLVLISLAALIGSWAIVDSKGDGPYNYYFLFLTVPLTLFPHWYHYHQLKIINPGAWNESNNGIFKRFFMHREIVSFMYIFIWFIFIFLSGRNRTRD